MTIHHEIGPFALPTLDTCVYCGQPSQVLDHVKPRCIGGQNVPTNVLPACTPCNSAKAGRTLFEWFVSMQRRQFTDIMYRRWARVQLLMTHPEWRPS